MDNTVNYSLYDVSREVAKIFEEVYDDEDGHGNSMVIRLKEPSGDRKRRITHANTDRYVMLIEVKEGVTKLDFTFSDDRVEEKVKSFFDLSTNMSSRRGRDKDDEEWHRRRRRKDKGGDDGRASSAPTSSRTEGNIRIARPGDEGSLTILPPFSKDTAGYTDRSPTIKSCEDCVHFVENGGCTLVRGDINPDGFCNEFFADVGFFGTNVDGVKLNLKLWGEMFDLDGRERERLVQKIQEAIEDK